MYICISNRTHEYGQSSPSTSDLYTLKRTETKAKGGRQIRGSVNLIANWRKGRKISTVPFC